MQQKYINYKPAHTLQFVLSGEDFFAALKKLIRNSREFLHLQTYIFEEDETGREMMEELKIAARRGVNVYLLTDAYGSRFSTATLHELRVAGIYYRSFSLVKGWKLGRRLHHKVALNDQGEALVGGINIANKYRGWAGENAWLDFAIWLQGEACLDILKYCRQLFGRKHIAGRKWPAAPMFNGTANGPLLQVAMNDWYRGRIDVSRAYLQSIRQAQTELFIVASYFLPGFRMRRELSKAAQRGVKVTLLLSSVSDVALVKPATLYLYQWMLSKQIQIIEWTPSVLHGKMMLRDAEWLSIGSYNINKLSDYGSIEMNVHVANRDFVQQVHVQLQALMTGRTVWVKPETFRLQYTLLKKLQGWLAYTVLRISLKLLLRLSEDQPLSLKGKRTQA